MKNAVQLPFITIADLLKVRSWLRERGCRDPEDYIVISNANRHKILVAFVDENNPLATLLALTWAK